MPKSNREQYNRSSSCQLDAQLNEADFEIAKPIKSHQEEGDLSILKPSLVYYTGTLVLICLIYLWIATEETNISHNDMPWPKLPKAYRGWSIYK
jgi:hypothetical protein